MKSDYVVQLLVECLTNAAGQPDRHFPLDHLISYVDYTDRNIPSLEEINAALAQVPEARAWREDGMIVFHAASGGPDGLDAIEAADFEHALAVYRGGGDKKSRKRQ